MKARCNLHGQKQNTTKYQLHVCGGEEVRGFGFCALLEGLPGSMGWPLQGNKTNKNSTVLAVESQIPWGPSKASSMKCCCLYVSGRNRRIKMFAFFKKKDSSGLKFWSSLADQYSHPPETYPCGRRDTMLNQWLHYCCRDAGAVWGWVSVCHWIRWRNGAELCWMLIHKSKTPVIGMYN